MYLIEMDREKSEHLSLYYDIYTHKEARKEDYNRVVLVCGLSLIWIALCKIREK